MTPVIFDIRHSGKSSAMKPKAQLPQTRRAAKDRRPPFHLTKRDAQIVEAVWRYRALTTPQIASLFFPSSSDKPSARCLLRLQGMFHYGYLRRVERPVLLSEGRKPFVYVLDREGAKLLTEGLGMDAIEAEATRHTPSFLEHLLATNDVRIAVVLSALQHGWHVQEWRDDRELSRDRDYVTLQGERGAHQRAAVVPDGWFRLSTGQHVYGAFLEADMATVTGEATRWDRRDMSRKMRTYLAYYDSGAYQQRYHTRGLRVCTVTTSDERLANLKRITEEAGGRSRFWFTTFDRVSAKTVLTAPIWDVAASEGRHSLVW